MAVRYKHANGYTLVELIAVLAIASILLLLATPLFRTQILNGRMSEAATDLLSTFAYARTEAVGRRNPVTICIRNEAADSCADTVQWEDGWLTFVDDNGNGDVDADEQIIQIHPALAAGTSARATGLLQKSITFRSTGRTDLDATETMIICDTRGFGESARALIVSLIGKASILNADESGEENCLRS